MLGSTHVQDGVPIHEKVHMAKKFVYTNPMLDKSGKKKKEEGENNGDVVVGGGAGDRTRDLWEGGRGCRSKLSLLKRTSILEYYLYCRHVNRFASRESNLGPFPC